MTATYVASMTIAPIDRVDPWADKPIDNLTVAQVDTMSKLATQPGFERYVRLSNNLDNTPPRKRGVYRVLGCFEHNTLVMWKINQRGQIMRAWRGSNLVPAADYTPVLD